VPENKKRHWAGQVVYVSMRVYDPVTKHMKHVRGRTVIFEKFTPDEVYRLIVEAGKAAHERARRERDGKGTSGEGGEGEATGDIVGGGGASDRG